MLFKVYITSECLFVVQDVYLFRGTVLFVSFFIKYINKKYQCRLLNLPLVHIKLYILLFGNVREITSIYFVAINGHE